MLRRPRPRAREAGGKEAAEQLDGEVEDREFELVGVYLRRGEGRRRRQSRD